MINWNQVTSFLRTTNEFPFYLDNSWSLDSKVTNFVLMICYFIFFKSFCLIFHSRQSSLISLLNFFLIFQFQVNSYQPPPNSPLLWKTSIHSLATCQAGKFLLVFALHVLTFTICALIGKAMFVHKMNLACWV